MLVNAWCQNRDSIRVLFKGMIFYAILLISPIFSESTEVSICSLNDRCVAQYCQDVEKRRGFQPGATGGHFLCELRGPVVAFKSSSQLTLPKTRALIIEEIFRLLTYFNSNLKAHLYLHEFPLNASNLDYTIRFENYNPQTIARVEVLKGNITYFKRDAAGKHTAVLTETADEAVEKLTNRSQGGQ